MRHAIARLTAAAAAVAAVSVATPASAQDDIGSNPINELFDAFGMGAKEKPEIDYRERPALVPPPSTAALPAPQQKGAVAQSTGQWPLDPDEQRRAEKRAEDALPRTEQRDYKMERDPRLPPSELGRRRVATTDDGTPAPNMGAGDAPPRMTPGELMAGPRSAPTGYAQPATMDNKPIRLSPEEMRNGARAKRDTVQAPPITPGVEPQRRRLTDPPEGYRMPSATAAGQTAAAPPQKAWYQKLNPFSSN